ncbi:hypothetical protein LZ009_08400 [Ramlibacter sp. XY19]|uniref:hypothetical protein n=1 Tax=Ramlibacter paludis TaxID=2908000 RepID=UPI0023DA9D34|nr:hypothetical protein [Ramlibacter paludis]MCG2592803.1 hypothetical protein [Ramlibacter paludis]
MCNLHKRPKFLDDGTMCRCESPLPGPTGTELSMWDHPTWGKSAPSYLGNERWFEQRYPDLLEHARTVFVEAVNDWVDRNWGEKQYDEVSPRIRVIGKNIYNSDDEATRNKALLKALASPKRFLFDNAFEACGDVRQSKWEADKVLGQFAIDIVTPVTINYSQQMVRIEPVHSFAWSTEMYVDDTMGLQPNDPIVTGILAQPLLDNVPSRRVKRAKWQIGGSGVKKDS